MNSIKVCQPNTRPVGAAINWFPDQSESFWDRMEGTDLQCNRSSPCFGQDVSLCEVRWLVCVR